MTRENADARRGSAASGTPVSTDPAGATRRGPRHARHPSRWSFGAALALTVVGALIPGTAFLAAGRRVLGALTLLAFLLLVGGGIWLATDGRHTALRAAVDTDVLLWSVGALALLTLLWIAVVIGGYRALVPPVSPRRYVLGGLLVALLVVGVAGVGVVAGRLLLAQRDLIVGVFAEDGKSATVTTSSDPFGSKDRVNVLLLGGDGGVGREGVRTDTVIVASIDTTTGDTTLFSLPRNLENLPFPPGSPLAEAYPNGFEAGSESESLLNAVYRNGPAAHPDILGPTDNPGADFLKLGVGEALGLHLDYYVLVNMDGFSGLVDALGGITVNVNYWVPINGITSEHVLPDDYISPGANRHMDGTTALQFSRGRFGLSDYLRMDRQRCVMSAIVAAADPVTMLLKYQQLAATTQDIVSTDIPSDVLDDFADLAFKVKGAGMTSVVFDDKVIRPAYPDYDKIRSLVQESLAGPPPSQAPAKADAAAPAAGGATSSGSGGAAASGSGSGSGSGSSDSPAAAATPADNVTDACAYDPEQAKKELAKGKPPIRKR
jgi:LCP family protein required for cell wall assembly